MKAFQPTQTAGNDQSVIESPSFFEERFGFGAELHCQVKEHTKATNAPSHLKERPSQKVSFALEPIEISFTMEDVDSRWYNEKEYGAFKKEVTKSCKMLEAGELSEDSDEYCQRGLDAYLKSTKSDRSERRMNCLSVAIDGTYKNRDASTIASKYAELCASAVAIARAKALKDEINARFICF